VLDHKRDVAKAIDDVVAMRDRLSRDRPPRHPFDLKLMAGGLIDLEFIAQSAQLIAGKEIALPQAPPARVLQRMAEIGLLPDAGRLADIHAHYSMVLQVMSAALTDPFREEGWADGFRELLAQRANAPSFERLADDLKSMQQEVQAAAAVWYAKARRMTGSG
jgi:glutamate-ammonia-ligase adenylyltransferase